jgi:stearoyl-CoA desaturase (delta-9 desaturase)
MALNLPLDRINWKTSIFLMSTTLIALTAVPVYLWYNGLNTFQVSLFLFYFAATGFSITLGYHRLFSHLAFKAKWPVKLFTLVFGAAAFQNSAIDWTSDHRKHHKHVDHDDDPYDISQGFFHAHIGWLLFKLRPEPPLDNVADLQRDPMVAWQHKWCHLIGFGFGFILPAVLGWFYGGPTQALGAFLIAGVARLVFVQQMTFFINSLCHTVGRRPYSSECSARDSAIMALFTFGEGYHNYHHEFQHDYRNGVKPWQFDPTKWLIWTLSKLGLASNLRRVPDTRILMAEAREAQRRLSAQLEASGIQLADKTRQLLQNSQDKLTELMKDLGDRRDQAIRATEARIESSRELVNELRHEIRLAFERLELAGNLMPAQAN